MAPDHSDPAPTVEEALAVYEASWSQYRVKDDKAPRFDVTPEINPGFINHDDDLEQRLALPEGTGMALDIMADLMIAEYKAEHAD